MKTKLDLFVSATAFAQSTLDESSPHKLAQASLEKFDLEGQDPADWESWTIYLNQARSQMLALRLERAPSEVAKAAAAAAAKAATAGAAPQ